MPVSKGLQKLLANFVFRDSRLESHPKVLAAHVLVPSGNTHLNFLASVSQTPIPFGGRIDVHLGTAGYVWSHKQALIISDLNPPNSDHVHYKVLTTPPVMQSCLTVPIGDGSNVVGVLELEATEKDFFRREDIGRVQLLGALIAFIHERGRSKSANTEATSRLGRAMRDVRAELGLTQDELAYRSGLSRIPLSEWERGRWPPSMGPIYQWCEALGLVAEGDEPQVSFLDVTPQLIVLLRDNPGELRNLSPERFEHVIAERIDRMGYDVQLTGATNQRDGGIDLIAIPRVRTVGFFLMAVQVKHHRTDRNTGRADVDRMLAWKDSPFRVGVMVTNTSFSQDAKWLADQAHNKAFLRLRDLEDLKRWFQGQFDSEFDWREIPDFISLAPGITVPVPKVSVPV